MVGRACGVRTVYIWGLSIECCWYPLTSEKERLKEGAAMMPCGEFAYMAGCEDEPEGKD